MKKRMITFGKIPTIKETIRDVTRGTRYVGVGDDGEEIYDKDIPLPIYNKVNLTEKIHGANASWCYNENIGFWVQSRRKIISSTIGDNVGCAVNAEAKEKELIEMSRALATYWNIDLEKYIITVFYEWAGGNIQKKSALSSLDKMSIIFKHFKVSPIVPKKIGDTDEASYWLPTRTDNWIENKEIGFHNVMNFPILKVDFDFNDLEETNNLVVNEILKLEKNSKVGEVLGVKNNVGEGYVGTIDFNKIIVNDNEIVINGVSSEYFSRDLYRAIKSQFGQGVHFPKIIEKDVDGFRYGFDILELSDELVIELMKLSNRFAFKYKGEEHANNTKMKKLKKVNSENPELENKKIEFVEKIACTQSRLEQFYDETKNEQGFMDMSLTPIFMKKVHDDIIAEELDNLKDYGLSIKDINKYVSANVVNYIKARLKDD